MRRRLHAHHTAAALVQVAHHIAHQSVWNCHLQISHRLQNHGTCLLQHLLICQRSRRFEGNFVRVDRMVRAVVEIRREMRHREARNALLHCLLNALFHCGIEVLRHSSAHNRNGEGQSLILSRRKAHFDVPVLSRTAVLLLVLAFHVNRLGDLFTISDLRRIVFDIQPEAALQPCGKNRQMNLAQAVDQKLLGFGVVLKPQGVILLDHLRDALGNLALVAFGGGGHALDVIRFREHDSAVFKRFVPCQRIVRIRVVQLCHHTDVSAGKFLDLGLFLAAHGIDVRQLLVIARGIVAQGHVAADTAVHHFKEGHFSHKRVCNRFEHENCGFALGNDVDVPAVYQRFLLLGGVTRERFGNLIEHRPNAPQLGCRAAEYGHDLAVNDALVDGVDRLHVRNLFPLEVLHHQILVGACNRFHQHIAVLRGGFFGFVRDHFHAVATVCVKNVRGLIDQVDCPHHFAAAYHRNGQRADIFTESLVKRIQYPSESCFIVVKFIDEERMGQTCRRNGIPCQLGSDLDARLSVHYNDRAVGNAQRLHNLTRKIQISGRVNDIDLDILPHHRRNGGRNRDLSGNLFRIIITDRISRGYGSESVRFSRQIEHCLREGSLSASAMPEQGNVSDVLCFNLSHCDTLFL